MDDKSAQSNRLFEWGMIASMACWGFSWTSGKILASYGTAMTISFLRFGFTFLSLIFILPLLKTRFTIAKNGLFDLIMASVMISVYTFLFFQGLVTGKAGAGGVLVTILNPIVSYAIMLAMSRRRPSTNETIGLLLGLAAGVILLKLFIDVQSIFTAANIYFLFASFSWAVLSVFTSRSSRYGEPLTFSLYMYGISTVIMFLVSGVPSILETVQKGDALFWLNMFFSATITTALATTFYFFATAKIGPGKASSYIFLVPISAALGSWFFLGEIPQWYTVVGGLLGIAAVYELNKKQRQSI